MSILKLENVRKTYEKHVAVNDVSFEMPEDCIFGMLGPNGAGKTSLIRIITTITRADSGLVLFDGEKLNSSHPSQIGYMPEERGLYKKMGVGEHLIYLARLKGLSKSEANHEIGSWFEKFGITDWWDKKVEELSKGYEGKLPDGFDEKIKLISQKNDKLTIQLNPGDDSNALLRHLIQQDVHINSFNEILPTLNEIFIKQVETDNLEKKS